MPIRSLFVLTVPSKSKGRLRSPQPPSTKTDCSRCLALRELEAASRLRLAVFLALDHAAIAREEAALLQHHPQRGFEMSESAADAVPHGAGLTGEPAARDRADHIILVQPVAYFEGLAEQHAQHGARKIGGDVSPVHGH